MVKKTTKRASGKKVAKETVAKKKKKSRALPEVVTVVWLLQQKDVCLAGLKWFARHYPNGVPSDQESLTAAIMAAISDKTFSCDGGGDMYIEDIADTILTGPEDKEFRALLHQGKLYEESMALAKVLRARK